MLKDRGVFTRERESVWVVLGVCMSVCVCASSFRHITEENSLQKIKYTKVKYIHK